MLMFRRGFRVVFVFQVCVLGWVCVSGLGFRLSLVFWAWVVVDLWVLASQFVFMI